MGYVATLWFPLNFGDPQARRGYVANWPACGPPLRKCYVRRFVLVPIWGTLHTGGVVWRIFWRHGLRSQSFFPLLMEDPQGGTGCVANWLQLVMWPPLVPSPLHGPQDGRSYVAICPYGGLQDAPVYLGNFVLVHSARTPRPPRAMPLICAHVGPQHGKGYISSFASPTRGTPRRQGLCSQFTQMWVPNTVGVVHVAYM